MAAGYSGTVAVYAAAQTMTWGKPNGNAEAVASIASRLLLVLLAATVAFVLVKLVDDFRYLLNQ